MATYAFLNEIWTSDVHRDVKEEHPTCNLLNKKMDNIMDAYMTEAKKTDVQTTTMIEKQCFNGELDGYSESTLLKNAYNLADDYTKELDYFKTKTQEDAPSAGAGAVAGAAGIDMCEEEVPSMPLSKDKIYEDIYEKFINLQQPVVKNENVKNMYIELIIYVLSGIFIIIVMEQIFRMGKSLR